MEAVTYELLDCGALAAYNADAIPPGTSLTCRGMPLSGTSETPPWMLACICPPDTVDSLIVWDAESPSTSSPSSEAFPASAARSPSKPSAKASTSSSTAAPTGDNHLEETSNNLQAKSIKVQLGLGLGIGIPRLILAFLGIRCIFG